MSTQINSKSNNAPHYGGAVAKATEGVREKFDIVQSTCIPIAIDNNNTDNIIPQCPRQNKQNGRGHSKGRNNI